jgi:hypothetical protein
MFELVLTNGVTDLKLIFKVRDTAIAQKWFCELQKNYELFETDRFSNWNNDSIIKDLNFHIDVINGYDNIVDKKVSANTSQQDLNYLHKFFEDLRGEITAGTTWFNTAPVNIQHSVERFNVLIHQLESTLRTGNKHPTVDITFKNRPRLELDDKDITHFTYKWESGCVYIGYCHVGKDVLDVYKDKDNLTDAVRPQTHYSADFVVKFGPGTNWVSYFIRSLLIKQWLKTRNFQFKNLNIGMIPVADLQTEVDKKTLTQFNIVKEIICLQ